MLTRLEGAFFSVSSILTGMDNRVKTYEGASTTRDPEIVEYG